MSKKHQIEAIDPADLRKAVDPIDAFKNSVASAEGIIDKLCENGGNHLYNKYLVKKMKPYSIL